MLGFNIGIDLLHIARIRSLLSRQGNNPTRFAAKILTPHERNLFTRKFPVSQPSQQQQQTHQTQQQQGLDTIARYLAVRWAAKEAAYKASSFTKEVVNDNNNNHNNTGTGEEVITLLLPPPPTWKDFEVLYKDNGRPYLAVLKDGEFVREGKLSISHDGDFVVAVAVLPE